MRRGTSIYDNSDGAGDFPVDGKVKEWIQVNFRRVHILTSFSVSQIKSHYISELLGKVNMFIYETKVLRAKFM